MTFPKTTAAALAAAFYVSGAWAQTHVHVYGQVDTSLVKESGSDTRFDENNPNLFGIYGREELGGGVSATFRLEKEFILFDGSKKETYSLDDAIGQRFKHRGKNPEFIGAANIGLTGGFGEIRIGRMPNISVEYFTETDPFAQGATGASTAKYSLLRSEQLSETVRYDAVFGGALKLSVSATLGGRGNGVTGTKGYRNHGFAAGAMFEKGPVMLTATYQRQADSKNSYVTNAGGTYRFGDFKVYAGYQYSKLKDLSALEMDDIASPATQTNVLAGIDYETGRWRFAASYNHLTVKDSDFDGNGNKYALGAFYELSKRTSLYTEFSLLGTSNGKNAAIHGDSGTTATSVKGYQIGVTHTF